MLVKKVLEIWKPVSSAASVLSSICCARYVLGGVGCGFRLEMIKIYEGDKK